MYGPFDVPRVNRNRTVSVGRQLVSAYRTQQVSFLSASIAYYMFVSLLPLLLLGLAVATAVGDEAFVNQVVEAAGAVLTPQAAQLLGAALTSASGRGGATVASLAVIVWGSLKVFRGVDTAFSRIYDTHGTSSFLESLVDAVAALGGIGLALLGFAVVG